MSDHPITQDALDRLQETGRRELAAESCHRREMHEADMRFAAERDLRYAERAEAVKALRDERDRRYSERHEAGRDARIEALAATSKALDVLAESQKEYKASQNEWRGTINDILATQRGSKTGTRELVAYVVTAISVALGVAAYLAK